MISSSCEVAQCPVCLETLFDSGVGTVLSNHLYDFLIHRTFIGFADSVDRIQCLQQYTVEANFNVLRKRKIPDSIIALWKEESDLGKTTFHTSCGHSVHLQCASRLCMQSYEVSQSTHADVVKRMLFAPLPRVVRYVTGNFTCPVCRADVEFRYSDSNNQSPTHYYHEQWEEETQEKVKNQDLGPYRLRKGAVVWVYDKLHQPGHPEAGTIGKLVGFAAPTTVADKSLMDVQLFTDTVTVIQVPVFCVFDIAFLLCTGIPSRSQVMNIWMKQHLRQYRKGIGLLTDNFALPDAICAAQSSGDRHFKFAMEERYAVVNTMFKQQTAIVQAIKEHCGSERLSPLCPSGFQIGVNYNTLWKYILAPRLGVSGQQIDHFYPSLTRVRPAPYQVVEKIATETGYPLPYIVSILNYASAGWLIHSTCLDVIKWCQKLQANPKNQSLFTEFSVPDLLNLTPVSPVISNWAHLINLHSEYEEKRIKKWCEMQSIVTWLLCDYWFTNPEHLRKLQEMAPFEYFKWFKNFATVLPLPPDSKSDSKSHVSTNISHHSSINVSTLSFRCMKPDELPAYYWQCSRIRTVVDRLRECASCYTSIPRSSGNALDTKQNIAEGNRAKLRKVRQYILDKYKIDLYCTTWYELPDYLRDMLLNFEKMKKTN